MMGKKLTVMDTCLFKSYNYHVARMKVITVEILVIVEMVQDLLGYSIVVADCYLLMYLSQFKDFL